MCLDQLLEGGKGDFDDPLEEDDEVRSADDEDLELDEGDLEQLEESNGERTSKSEAVNNQGNHVIEFRQNAQDFRIQKRKLTTVGSIKKKLVVKSSKKSESTNLRTGYNEGAEENKGWTGEDSQSITD